jgi:hypothetical protein
MQRNRLEGIVWYQDADARARDEPGICHSYVASLATALHYMHGDLDPVWLMGSSAFAFRINVSEVLCPSAMSIFDWSADLPQAVEQAGYACNHIIRLWDDDDLEEERRSNAHTAILAGIAEGVPAVVWDVHDAEWGMVIGYDDETRTYDALTYRGQTSSLPYDRLGRNGIDILSVTIPGRPNDRPRSEAIRSSLSTAIAHATGKEWTERPAYQNGLAGYDLWATVFERWALLVERGKAAKIPPDMPDRAAYYARHYYSARCYARDYLRDVADGSDDLGEAFRAYAHAAASLRPVWEASPQMREPSAEFLRSMASNARNAKTAEREGLEHIERYLSA